MEGKNLSEERRTDSTCEQAICSNNYKNPQESKDLQGTSTEDINSKVFNEISLEQVISSVEENVNHNYETLPNGKDEGISDCSPSASERDCSSPSLNNKPVSSKSDNIVSAFKDGAEIEQKSDKQHSVEDGARIEEVDYKSLVGELEQKIKKQQLELEKSSAHIQHLERVTVQQGLARGELESRFQTLVKHYENALKEKEASVMRYAISEKNVIDQRNAREIAEKRLQEANHEIDILTNKITSMGNEKSRICQMLDNKCHELTSSQKECERYKADLNSCEMKLKWAQNSLKSEMDAHKECLSQVEILNNRLQEATNQVQTAKQDAQNEIRAFRESQENRAHVLDQQLKEQSATLILVRHERDDRDQQQKQFKAELDYLHDKHQATIQENNALSVKIQKLEKERFEYEQKLSELREYADKKTQDAADLHSCSAQVEQLKLQLANEQKQLLSTQEQVNQFKQRNAELQADMEGCRVREADMLHFTQMLTDKNVRLQSEFSAVETKVQQLSCEQVTSKRTIKELEMRLGVVTQQLEEEKKARADENKILTRHLAERTATIENLNQEVEFQKGENLVIKRKLEASLKEMTKELQQNHKRLEQYENAESQSRSSSNSSLNMAGVTNNVPSPVPDSDEKCQETMQTETSIDKQTLLKHVIRLQKANARKSEKLDFLEEHVRTLVTELQQKKRLLQSYLVREQAGTLSSDQMDQNKAKVTKYKGVMSTLYGSKISDESLTLELSLDINQKLQAVLEDTLLKNMTLQENVDTLGSEIDRLQNQIKACQISE